jgi:hypothetical protein
MSNITIESIRGGFGLLVFVHNTGEHDAKDTTISVETLGGLLVSPEKKEILLPMISSGETVKKRILINGFGLGLLTPLPEIYLTLQDSENNEIESWRIVTRILGPFVIKVGESYYDDAAYKGYTLFSPMRDTKTYLINISGEVVHIWQSNSIPRCSVYLLENGNLLRTFFPGPNPRFIAGGVGGGVEILDWNGSLVWEFEYSSNNYCLHHDIEILPNGNVLMIAWEYKTVGQALEAGRDPNMLPAFGLWPVHIIEVQPTGPASGDIVWEWHIWDHLIQDFDPLKDNYGAVSDHPELIDLNYGPGTSDWLHTNSIDYHEQYDQILLSVKNFNEIWIIDHSTTTEEAAGHTGGNSGKGGDLLYRWGNPHAYQRGTPSDQIFYAQHDAQWIETNCPGSGNILVFNNGHNRPNGPYSSVDEFIPPVNESGVYYLEPGTPYEPETLNWTYTAENPKDFYALLYSGAQRFPNGNTLICNGPPGQFFEVTSEKETVWEYVNLFPDPYNSNVFNAHRYPPNYPGLQELFH